MFGLADCNNFFVSCERSVNPSLDGKAVVVLSNNDGCVVARSNESKRLGVKMGQPAFELRQLVESGRLLPISGNHLLYREISLKVHEIFRRFVPEAIDYSVDEAFLNMAGIPIDVLPEIGYGIRQACWEELRIPITVGFAPTKTLAKIITEVSKKQGHPVGIFRTAAEAMPILEQLPVAELWGIGRRMAKRLYQAGVYTLAQFVARNRAWVRQNLGVTGERSWLELQGVSCITLDHVGRPLQDSISESRTFPEDVDDYDYIRARIVIYASDCASKLRAMHGRCGGVGVFLRTNPFRSSTLPSCRPEAICRLDTPTSVTTDITGAALRVLDSIYIPSIPFKRAGVWLTDITPDVPVTPSLFDDPDLRDESIRRFMNAIDSINSHIGSPAIGLASRLVSARKGHNDGYSSTFQAPRDYPNPSSRKKK